jgi:hypothetical protein
MTIPKYTPIKTSVVTHGALQYDGHGNVKGKASDLWAAICKVDGVQYVGWGDSEEHARMNLIRRLPDDARQVYMAMPPDMEWQDRIGVLALALVMFGLLAGLAYIFYQIINYNR